MRYDGGARGVRWIYMFFFTTFSGALKINSPRNKIYRCVLVISSRIRTFDIYRRELKIYTRSLEV